eukprot:3200206-Prymnesium_polylepis.1
MIITAQPARHASRARSSISFGYDLAWRAELRHSRYTRHTPGPRLSSNGACGLRGQRARARAARPRPT